MAKSRICGALVVTESVALTAASCLLEKKRREIEAAFSPHFVKSLGEIYKEPPCTAERAVKAAQAYPGTIGYRKLGRGGIFNALWQLLDELSLGMEADLTRIPVLQETIEILELFDLNPYYADSAGSVLIATEHGYELSSLLTRKGIPNTVIGVLMPPPSRVIRMPDHIRHLDRPQGEELEKLGY